MKKVNISFFLMTLLSVAINAQEIKQVVQPLSAKASGGHLYNMTSENGTIDVIYQMKLNKKSDVLSFESYKFDADLKFKGEEPFTETKQQKPDRQQVYFVAYVGGTTSFDILSQKLKISKETRDEYWNYRKQTYMTRKVISRETVRPKNDLGKTYNAYAGFWEYGDGGISNGLIIAKADSKGKGQKQYLLLVMDNNLDLKEVPLDLEGAHTLVYAAQVTDKEIAMIFAPDKGASDVTAYTYYLYDIYGNQKNKVSFKSPASALLVTAAYSKDGDVYFFGTSKKSTDAFSKVFSEYSPIYNPGALTSKMPGANYLDVKWRDCQKQKMENFHLLKFSGNQLAMATTVPVSMFKTKFKTAPGDKGASVYQGKKFAIENFYITPSGDFLVAGQLTSSAFFGLENRFDAYQDVVCFHFDKEGNFKAQFGVGRANEDKASEIFDMQQNFYPSSDGSSLYWVLYEVKGNKDWYTGIPSPVYYPRVTKIDLSAESLSPVKVLGEGKYFLSDFGSQLDKADNSLLLVGSDLKEKNLWLGKIIFN